jgi:hypothetical protein
VNEQDIIEMKVDKNQDIIFMSVGMYKMFMANGTEGLEAKQLYDHLMFTARLQETNLIHASPGYISNGLAWGKAKVKRAKAFLQKKGLISYVQRRNSSGQLADTYIRVNFSRKDPQVEEGLEPEDEKQLALFGFITGGSKSIPPVKDNSGDSTDGSNTSPSANPSPRGIKEGYLHDNDNPDTAMAQPTGGSISVPPDRKHIQAGGTVNRPAASRTYGLRPQMLKKENKMLKERKRNEGSLPRSSEAVEIQRAFIQYYVEKFDCKPAALKDEEFDLIEEHVHRFGKLKTINLLYAFFTDRDSNVSEFARKAGYRYKVFSSQIEALMQLKSGTEKPGNSRDPEPPEVCPTCGKRHWRRVAGLRMCAECRTMVQLVDGRWEVDPSSVPATDTRQASGQ